jgi:peptide/nickel transport system ATP-binding protein
VPPEPVCGTFESFFGQRLRTCAEFELKEIMFELLREIQKEQQFATLFVSHDLAVVDLLSDRIAVMQHGEIVEQGTKDQILRNLKVEYTKKLIAAVPVPDPEEQELRRNAR